MVQRVSKINSNSTQLVNDYDLERIGWYFVDNSSGVLFADIDTKAEFDYNVGTGDIAVGYACIKATRTASTPIPSEEIPIIFRSSAVENIPLVANNKVYIEIDNSLLQDPSLIVDG